MNITPPRPHTQRTAKSQKGKLAWLPRRLDWPAAPFHLLVAHLFYADVFGNVAVSTTRLGRHARYAQPTAKRYQSAFEQFGLIYRTGEKMGHTYEFHIVRDVVENLTSGDGQTLTKLARKPLLGNSHIFYGKDIKKDDGREKTTNESPSGEVGAFAENVISILSKRGGQNG